ncbi:hypothetical protein MBLNU230_g7161t1 [Neophaeotheca triangularis]
MWRSLIGNRVDGSSVNTAIRKLEEQNKLSHASTTTALKSIESDIVTRLEALKLNTQQDTPPVTAGSATQAALDTTECLEICRKLEQLSEQSHVASIQQGILLSLEFESMVQRQEAIKDAHDKTFERIFYKHRRGDTKQKSQEGLLRTLLHSIFRQCPSLIERVCPSRWGARVQSKVWRQQEMADCLERLGQLDLQHHGEAFKFCFFIDGLDEYGGDHDHIVSVVQRFASSGSIKVCVTSRPWLDFKDAIAQTGNYNCVLHKHTASDINKYVAGKFQGTRIRGQAKADVAGFKNLQQKIVRKADGVFLWVFLVVRELQRGLRSKDTYHDLEMRLEHIPSELSDYFTRMLDGLDSFHRKKSARLLLMCLEGVGRILGLSVAVLDFEQPLEILDMDAEERDSDVLFNDILALEDKAIAYGTDLVSVHGTPSSKEVLENSVGATLDIHYEFSVQLSHRSMLYSGNAQYVEDQKGR